LEDVVVDKDEHKRTQISQTSWFGKLVHLVVDYTTKGLVTKLFTNLGRIGGWKNSRMNAWSRNFD
jgi:hypothetical protein